MTIPQPIRFGLIGVDSSHALQFTRLFGDGVHGAVRGGTVVAAWQGPTSVDFPPSRDRNDANAAALVALGVALLPSAEAVAETVDALLLVTSDARTRREQFTRIAPAGKPVYVDTRFAANPGEARDMLRLAEESGCRVSSGSPKRFTPQFRALPTTGVDSLHLIGPLVEQPGHTGLAWYGVHLVDLAVATFGAGCVRVEPGHHGLRLIWADGRHASLTGPAEWNPWTLGRAHTPSGEREFEIEADEDMLVGLLQSLVEAYRSGEATIDHAQILEITEIVEAGSRVLATGVAVDLAAADSGIR